MAWHYGTFGCGCEGRVNITGPTKNRQWIADRKFEGLCPECWEEHLKEERERKNKEAAEKAKEMELPDLKGTEKQVAWANTLRQNFIEKIDKFIEEFKEDEDEWEYYKEKYNLERLENIEDIIIVRNYVLENIKDAKEYIDERYDFLRILSNEVKNACKTNEEIEDEKIYNDIKLESTVFPEDAITNVATEIIVKKDEIQVKFEKNDNFIDIVKSLNFSWEGIWKRDINYLTGSSKDRAAELGNKLLNAGFPICILDEETRNNAINGVFEPECDRWINVRGSDDYKGWLSIRWYDKSNLYDKARKLPGSKWSNPSVVVRIEHYKEVEEFAELYNFKFSNAALETINEYKESLKEVKIVDPTKVEKEKPKDGLKEILNSSTEILDDLLEEE